MRSTPRNKKKLSQRKEKIVDIEERLRVSFNSAQIVERRLREHIDLLKSWEPHYDFLRWNTIEEKFNSIWIELFNEIRLGMEYELYEEVRDAFFEVRNLMQWVGLIKERIYIATWLKRHSKARNEYTTNYLALSSLVWSYTSSGHCQNPQKAEELWEILSLNLIRHNKPLGFDAHGREIRAELELSLYVELLIDTHENGVRLAIRQGKLDKAEELIGESNKKIDEMTSQQMLPPRLRERFLLVFMYHQGIVQYLRTKQIPSQNHTQPEHPSPRRFISKEKNTVEEYLNDAETIFQQIVARANFIGWERIEKGAKSWLATISIQGEDYAKTEGILAEIFKNSQSVDKRDAFCHLLKARLHLCQGDSAEGRVYSNEACRLFELLSRESEEFSIYSYHLL